MQVWLGSDFENENIINMKIQIENLRAQMRGVQLNSYQRALALNEYYKLIDYVEELEQLTIPAVVGRSELLNAFLDYADPIYWGENECTDRKQLIEQFLKSIQ
jgi:hypothetical protein